MESGPRATQRQARDDFMKNLQVLARGNVVVFALWDIPKLVTVHGAFAGIYYGYNACVMPLPEDEARSVANNWVPISDLL